MTAQHPQQLARCLVRAEIEAAEGVDEDHDEEHRGAVGVRVAQEPAIVHVAHDVLDAVERHQRVRRVVHRQHDAGEDLQRQRNAGERAEVPPVVQVLRRRIGDELAIEQAGIGRRSSIQRRTPLLKIGVVLSAIILSCRSPSWARERAAALLPLGLPQGSADADRGIGEERVLGHGQVHRRRALPDPAGIVVRAMAGAEPAAELPRCSVGLLPSGTQPRWVQMPITISHSGF